MPACEAGCCGISGRSDGYVAKADSNGTVLWVMAVGGYTGDGSATGVAKDAKGNAFACGMLRDVRTQACAAG